MIDKMIKRPIQGYKKGGSEATEEENSLRSSATARVIDLISEGPTEGIVDGLKGVYLNQTPVQAQDGSYNFSGVYFTERTGETDQDWISGFPAAETEVGLNTEVKYDFPITRTISDASTDAIRVKINVPQLSDLDTDSGDLRGSKVELQILVKTATGTGFVLAKNVTIEGKNVAPYERSIRIDLPSGGAPWDVRVVRITEDSDRSSLSNSTVWTGYTQIVDAKLSYPDTALAALLVDARQFGNRVAERTYHYKGIHSPVPSNYNPVTREYTGIWDGTFKSAYHNNPAWVLYALKTNKRYGLGDFISPEAVDKFGLYEIGQYCDELVPDGYGGTEPRYTFNGVIRSRTEAAKVLDNVASVFRGMLYWGAGAVTTTADMPSTAKKLVTPANVLEGTFTYSGTPLSARSSSVAVTWANPADLGKTSVLIVQRDDLIRKFGDRRREISAVGCTSRGQAQRVAEWILYTEEYETEIVTYQASLDHANVRPGTIVSIADPSYAGARMGGRLVSVTDDPNGAVFVLDGAVTMDASENYSISIMNPDGEIKSFDLVNPDDTVTTVTASTDFAAAGDVPEAGAMWIITGSDVAPRDFRVISNIEKKKNVYEITGTIYNDSKYGFVERNLDLDPGDFTVFDDYVYVKKATGLSGNAYLKPQSGSASEMRLVVAWDDPVGVFSQLYRVYVTEPGEGRYLAATTESTNIEIAAQRSVNGNYFIDVQAVGLNGASADITSVTVDTSALFALTPIPTGWTAESTLDGIVLTGDTLTNPAFKAFRIYSATDANDDLTFIDETPATKYVRPIIDGDTVTRYKVSSVDHNDVESVKTDFIYAIKSPAFAQAVGRIGIVENEYDTAYELMLENNVQDFLDQAHNAEELVRVRDELLVSLGDLESTIVTDYLLAADADFTLASFRRELTSSLGLVNLITQPYPYTGSTNVFGNWTNVTESSGIPAGAPTGATSYQVGDVWAVEGPEIVGNINGESFSVSLDLDTSGASGGAQVGVFTGTPASPTLVSSISFAGATVWTNVTGKLQPTTNTTSYFFGVRAASSGQTVRFRNIVVQDDSERAGIYAELDNTNVTVAAVNESVSQQSLQLQSSFKPGDWIITNSPRTDSNYPLGGWTGGVTSVSTRPSSAPSFAKSFRFSDAYAEESPRRIVNLNGRSFKLSAWINASNAPSGLRIDIAGADTNDAENATTLFATESFTNSGWTLYERVIEFTVDTVNFIPRIRCYGAGETADVYSLEMYDSTDAKAAEALVLAEQTARTTAVDSVAADLTLLTSDFGDYQSTAAATFTTQAQVDSTIAGYDLSLNSTFGDLEDDVTGVTNSLSGYVTNATLTSNYLTAASTTSAISQAITDYTVSFEGNNVSLQTIAQAVDGVRGEWGVAVNNNGVVSGVNLTSELVDGAGAVSKFTIQADKFTVVTNTNSTGTSAKTPFSISGGYINLTGDVRINGSLIVGSSIGTDALATSVTSSIQQGIDDASVAQSAATTAQSAASTAQSTASSAASAASSAQSTASSAANAASTALSTANGKNKTFRQSSTPTATAVGDMWIDIGNDKIKRWSGSSWVSATLEAESVIASWAYVGELSANQINVGTLNANRINLAGSVLSVDGAGRLTVGPGAVTATEIDNAVTDDIQQGIDDAAAAQAAANSAQSTANSRNRTFRQSTQPTATATGDIWVNTSTDTIYRWSGSSWVKAAIEADSVALSWAYIGELNATQITVGTLDANRLKLSGNVVSVDASGRLTVATGAISSSFLSSSVNADIQQGIDDAASAQSIANGKNKIFRSFASSVPTASAVGDIWMDLTNDKIKFWSGSSWTTPDIEAESVAANWVYTNTLTATQVNAVAINANSISVGLLDANRISLAGNVVTVDGSGRLTVAQGAVTANEIADAVTDDIQKGIDDAAAAQLSAGSALTLAGIANGTANGKNKTFRQSSTPTATATGDIWIDTGSDKIKRWSGSSWVSAALEAESVAANWIYANTLTAGQVNAVEINANSISVGQLNAERLSIDGVTLDTDGFGNLIINSGGVDTTQLATDAVTTVKVIDNAVSEPFGTATGSTKDYSDLSGGWVTLISKSMNVTDVEQVKIDWFMEQGYLGGSTGKWKYRILRGTTPIKSRDAFMFNQLDQAAGSWTDTTPGTGTVTYNLQWSTDDTSNNHTCKGTINLSGRKK